MLETSILILALFTEIENRESEKWLFGIFVLENVQFLWQRQWQQEVWTLKVFSMLLILIFLPPLKSMYTESGELVVVEIQGKQLASLITIQMVILHSL